MRYQFEAMPSTVADWQKVLVEIGRLQNDDPSFEGVVTELLRKIQS